MGEGDDKREAVLFALEQVERAVYARWPNPLEPGDFPMLPPIARRMVGLEIADWAARCEVELDVLLDSLRNNPGKVAMLRELSSEDLSAFAASEARAAGQRAGDAASRALRAACYGAAVEGWRASAIETLRADLGPGAIASLCKRFRAPRRDVEDALLASVEPSIEAGAAEGNKAYFRKAMKRRASRLLAVYGSSERLGAGDRVQGDRRAAERLERRRSSIPDGDADPGSWNLYARGEDRSGEHADPRPAPDDSVILLALEKATRCDAERTCLRLMAHGASPTDARRRSGLSESDWEALQARSRKVIRGS